MKTGVYKIADQVIEITSLYPAVHEMCSAYQSEEKTCWKVTVCQEDIDAERRKSRMQNEREGIPVREYPDAVLETLAVYRKISSEMLRRNTLLFHGSAVAVDGKAYLFTAKSGTGKSTHTALWRQVFGSRAVMVNDDKPLLKISEEGVFVCGTPWNGKHHLGENIIVPLCAVCVLERGKENRIRPAAVREILPVLIGQSYHPKNAAERAAYFPLLDQLAKKTKFYRLQCNMNPDAARIAYDGMRAAAEQ